MTTDELAALLPVGRGELIGDMSEGKGGYWASHTRPILDSIKGARWVGYPHEVDENGLLTLEIKFAHEGNEWILKEPFGTEEKA